MLARGTVIDGFDRNRHVLQLTIDVTVGCKNDLNAAARYLQELLPDVLGELEHPTRVSTLSAPARRQTGLPTAAMHLHSAQHRLCLLCVLCHARIAAW